jgi:hypothetical protein
MTTFAAPVRPAAQGPFWHSKMAPGAWPGYSIGLDSRKLAVRLRPGRNRSDSESKHSSRRPEFQCAVVSAWALVGGWGVPHILHKRQLPEALDRRLSGLSQSSHFVHDIPMSTTSGQDKYVDKY